MKINRIRLRGYSGFEDSNWIKFKSGINLIIGQNNAGKTALLQAINRPMEDYRHRNPQRYEPSRLAEPRVELDLEFTSAELEDAFLQKGGKVRWPQSLSPAFPPEKPCPFSFLIENRPSSSLTDNSVYQATIGGITRYPKVLQLEARDGQLVSYGETDATANLMESIDPYYQRKVFWFNSQRFGLGRCGTGDNPNRLHPNASNLPAVLNELQGRRPDTFDLLRKYVREIFPTVYSMSVSLAPGNTSQLVVWVWPTEDMSRAELNFPLDACGAGVAQVVAILTVVLTLKNAVIAIDEIGAFLHPAAAKALVRILNTYHRDHQYIISVHSTDIIAAAEPTTVHLVRRQGFTSGVQELDLSSVTAMRVVARELGVSMSDVFGADRIVWVEGETEAKCFPYIIATRIGEVPRGTIFSPVAATSDFNAKRPRSQRVFDIYDTISKKLGILVEAVAFSFDRELLSDAQAKEFELKSEGRLLLLPRRCFECYLLDPDAISALALRHASDLMSEANPSAFRAKIEELGGLEKYGAATEWNGDCNNSLWLARVDAARLLNDMLSSCTATRVTYDKARDAIELVKHIAERRPEQLEGLVEYLKRILSLIELPKASDRGLS